MKIGFTKNFIKQSKKLEVSSKLKLQARIEIFVKNPLDPMLRNRALKGKYSDYRSIDITGDLRALYLQKTDEAIFDLVGTHSQLY